MKPFKFWVQNVVSFVFLISGLAAGWGLAPVVPGPWYFTYPGTMLVCALVALWLSGKLWMAGTAIAGYYFGKYVLVPLLVVQPHGMLDKLRGVGAQAYIQETLLPIIVAIAAVGLIEGIVFIYNKSNDWKRWIEYRDKKKAAKQATAKPPRQ